MLTISLPETDSHRAVELHLEHSLVSLSKWEEIYEKPFFNPEPRSEEESLDYIRMMALDIYPEDTYARLNNDHFTMVQNHINAKRSATWFNEAAETKSGPQVTITSELIYYWLLSFEIPFSPCENWHLNRLMTLIRITGIKKSPPKKMSPQEQAEQYRKLNEERRRKFNSNG